MCQNTRLIRYHCQEFPFHVTLSNIRFKACIDKTQIANIVKCWQRVCSFIQIVSDFRALSYPFISPYFDVYSIKKHISRKMMFYYDGYTLRRGSALTKAFIETFFPWNRTGLFWRQIQFSEIWIIPNIGL